LGVWLEEQRREGQVLVLASSLRGRRPEQSRELSGATAHEPATCVGVSGHEPLRAYGNGHTFGCEGYIHVDNRDTDNYFSTIIYTNPDWKAPWGGETLFYTLDEKDIIKAAAALPFRIVSFPGHIPHKANAPARDCPHFRSALVFKSHIGAKHQPAAAPAAPAGVVMPTPV
jgi:hypothetical protein